MIPFWRILSACLLAAALALRPGGAGQLSAQALLVRVTDASTGEPLQGALTTLTDGSGTAVASALSDAAGRVRFLDLTSGDYDLRVEMIGYASVRRTESARSGGPPRVVEVRLDSRAIELEGLSVEGEERCRVRPEDGLRVAAVWDEARKALEAARWTEDRGVYRYRLRSFVRDVEGETGRVADQRTTSQTVYTGSPYASLPAERLMAEGFVQADPADPQVDVYYAPDASVLLSDLFLDAHCIRLTAGTGDRAGLVGLAFEPVDGRRLPDIAGTLWVDPDSWRLVRLDFRYVNLDRDVGLRDVGGDVGFQRLPNGTWIIPEWRIRMPWLAVARGPDGRERIYQHGIREQGADVLFVSEPGGDVVLRANSATVEGVVLEEISSEPVADATVRLDGTDTHAVTDSAGRFRLTDVVPGRYDLLLGHADVTAWGEGPEAVGVEARAGEVSAVVLRLPSALTLLARACAEELDSRPEKTAVLVGRVLDRASGLPLEGVEVTVEWTAWRAGGMSGAYLFGRDESGVRLVTGADGSFQACVVPENTKLTLTAALGPFTSEPDTVRIPEGAPLLVRDLHMGIVGHTTVIGSVVGYEDGSPLAAARVTLRPLTASAEPGRTLTADQDGRFAVDDAVVGAVEMEVSALGYATVRDTVVTRSGRMNHVTIRVPRQAVEVDGLTVTVDARLERLDRTGFYQRRREGLGYFLDVDAIEAAPVTAPSQLFRMAPGLQVRYTSGQSGGRAVVTLANGCVPALYLDGTRVRAGGPFVKDPNPTRTGGAGPPLYLDDLVSLGDIAGVEVFRSPAEAPAGYTGTGSDCGVMLVWTR